MNLNEECLLKYLINPLELSFYTELLKENNEIISKKTIENNLLANMPQIVYSTNSI